MKRVYTQICILGFLENQPLTSNSIPLPSFFPPLFNLGFLPFISNSSTLTHMLCSQINHICLAYLYLVWNDFLTKRFSNFFYKHVLETFLFDICECLNQFMRISTNFTRQPLILLHLVVKEISP